MCQHTITVRTAQFWLVHETLGVHCQQASSSINVQTDKAILWKRTAGMQLFGGILSNRLQLNHAVGLAVSVQVDLVKFGSGRLNEGIIIAQIIFVNDKGGIAVGTLLR